ncbi:hypothetical protein [Actinokineospora inagensis]|uniref:hypothetical protein n=1 Tax=Actinokineospora inagensis TaxID=103730 RepID=UPI000413AE23|nr:hypothetical protein [Actinokineospora inagensis]
MLLRPLVLFLLAAALTSCATVSTAEPSRPKPALVREQVNPATATAAPTTTTRSRQPGLMVGSPKTVPDDIDCAQFTPLINKATGVKAEPLDSSAQLCRYRLPYPRGTTNVSVMFRAEPPGTPSYVRTADMYGNTAYQVVGVDSAACGYAVALDPYLAANERGSHLTVLGSFENNPCGVARKIIDAIFERLPDTPV